MITVLKSDSNDDRIILYHVAHELNFILKSLFGVHCSSHDNILEFLFQTLEEVDLIDANIMIILNIEPQVHFLDELPWSEQGTEMIYLAFHR